MTNNIKPAYAFRVGDVAYNWTVDETERFLLLGEAILQTKSKEPSVFVQYILENYPHALIERGTKGTPLNIRVQWAQEYYELLAAYANGNKDAANILRDSYSPVRVIRTKDTGEWRDSPDSFVSLIRKYAKPYAERLERALSRKGENDEDEDDDE